MKRFVLLLVNVSLAVLLVVAVCNKDSIELKWDMHQYQKVMEGKLPADLTLTIYYLPHYILTRAPLTVDKLKNMRDTVKIVVPSYELAKYLPILRRLDASSVQPAAEKYGLNARLYYVFETGGTQVLEVTMQQFIGDDEAFGAFVNGMQVKKNPVLYEVILPFLTEEDRNKLGI